MYDALIAASTFVLPLFVFLTMFNVGLTQRLKNLLGHLRNVPFVLRMLVANFVLAPLVMWGLLQLFAFDPALEIGLTLLSLTAGAPFLIKLTQFSENDLALGASLMLLLVVGTVVTLPFTLPLVLPEATVDAAGLALALGRQLLLPIALGMLAAHFLPRVTETVQPWVAKIGTWALYVVIATTLGGYLPRLVAIFGQGAFLVGVVFVLAAFGIGYVLAGRSDRDDVQDVGALGTAQRNTAASMIVAVSNFGHLPDVMVIVTLVNMLGIVLLIAIAKKLSRDNPDTPETQAAPQPSA